MRRCRHIVRYWMMVIIMIPPITGTLQAQGTASVSAEKGPALLAELCTKCHGLDEIVHLRQSREGWEETVYSMVARGAPIFTDEVVPIIDYLSREFPPSRP